MIELSLLIAKLAAAVAPKLTPVAPVNPVPVIVTLVPPAAGPEVEEMPVTLGAGTKFGPRVRYALFEAL